MITYEQSTLHISNNMKTAHRKTVSIQIMNKLIWKGGRKKRNLSNILCITEICNFWGIPTTLFIIVKRVKSIFYAKRVTGLKKYTTAGSGGID